MKFPREQEYQTKYRVYWGPLQTRKDTRQVLEPLYNCPFGIQAPKLETRINWNFQFPTLLASFSNCTKSLGGTFPTTCTELKRVDWVYTRATIFIRIHLKPKISWEVDVALDATRWTRSKAKSGRKQFWMKHDLSKFYALSVRIREGVFCCVPLAVVLQYSDAGEYQEEWFKKIPGSTFL